MTAVLDYGEIMSKKRLTEKKEQNARLVYSDKFKTRIQKVSFKSYVYFPRSY